jgi:hypothetical protein
MLVLMSTGSALAQEPDADPESVPEMAAEERMSTMRTITIRTLVPRKSMLS